jgi:hypothetical protein
MRPVVEHLALMSLGVGECSSLAARNMSASSISVYVPVVPTPHPITTVDTFGSGLLPCHRRHVTKW